MSTRQRSRSAEEASSSAGGARLQGMVDEVASASEGPAMTAEDWEMVDSQEFFDAPSQPQGNGFCTITDADRNPFPLMLLPAEIRNEIYRACLTRPFNILLSRKELPPQEPEAGVAESGNVGEAPARSDTEDDSDMDYIVSDEHGSQTRPRRFPNLLDVPGAAARASARSSVQSQPTGLRAWANRSTRPIRLLTSRSSSAASAAAGASTAAQSNNGLRRSPSRPARSAPKPEVPRAPRPQDVDPLLINLLGVSKTLYREARSILYNENLFTLDLETALPTLAVLHQRSRRQIKHVEIEIPGYNEILERFQETVRLSLRYCWGLKTFVIHMPFTLPGAEGGGTTSNTTVYANGFDILRWLPRQCEVVLRGNICAEIESVVSKNATLAKTLDELAYARRQLISNETERTPGA